MMARLGLVLVTMILVSASGSSRLDQRVKRSDVHSPLEAVVSRLTQTVEKLQAEVELLKATAAKRVSLRTSLSSENVTVNAPIHMKVIHQVGQSYDNITGIFSAPYAGWYAIDFQLFPKGAKSVYVDIYFNQERAGRAHCMTAVTCHSGVTLHLQPGDKLWAQSGYVGPYWTGTYDSFFAIELANPDD